jgi:hypothetical protein
MAHWRHILKKPQGEKSPAMERGNVIHKEGEDYLLGKKRTVPASFAAFKVDLASLKKQRAIAEGKWALDVKWQVAEYFDWARAWCRLVLDAHLLLQSKTARVVDFKTGRVYLEDNLEQVELYAVGAVAHYPQAKDVQVELWYLDQPRGAENPLVRRYDRAQVAKLQGKWKKKVVPILMDKRFVPNPGQECGRCAYSRRKGGECEH